MFMCWRSKGDWRVKSNSFPLKMVPALPLPSSLFRHIYIYNINERSLRRRRRKGVMASSSAKSLLEFLQPTNKRLKTAPPEALKVPISSSLSFPSQCQSSDAADSPSGTLSSISPEQTKRIEINKFLARSIRNRSICATKIEKAKGKEKKYVKLEELLVEETWLEALTGELRKPYMRDLCKFVEREVCGSQPVYPPLHFVFNALNSTPFDRVKAVIIGQDPYHGPGQAMGLAFSVPEGVKVPSSLVNIFKELKEDVGCTIPSHGNLERWAVQGVLLLNAVLTVRNRQANSHAKQGWEPFTDAIIKIISQKREGVVFLLWGNSAQEKSRLIDGKKHHILKAAHPSGLSAHRGFFGCRHFSRTNEILERVGLSPIDWQL